MDRSARRDRLVARLIVRGVPAAFGLASCLCSSTKAPSVQPAPSAPAVVLAPLTPEAIVGTWLFAMKMGDRSIEGRLHFTAEAGVPAGSLTGSDGNERELSNIKIEGDRISWDIAGQRVTQHAEGTVSGSSMKGTIKTKMTGGRGGGRGRDTDGDSDDGARPPSGGGGYRGGGRGRGRSGSGGGAREITWSAFKTVAPPPGESNRPATPPGEAPPPPAPTALANRGL